jgi:hypothetical protein
VTVINSFYRNPNALSYATQLFSASSSVRSQSESAPVWSQQEDSGFTETAGQKALARIVEILALRDAPDGDQASVDETMGYITAAQGTEANDKLTFDASAVYNIETGSGDDKVTVKAAAIVGLSTAAGNDSLAASARYISDIEMGEGDDELKLTGHLVMNVSGGEGNDSLTVAGEALIGIDGGAGDDTVTLEGTRIFASGGTGNDTVTIKRTDMKADNAIAEYDFARGDGMDTITSNGGLTLRFDGYTESDVTVTVKDNTLTATFAGSTDKITLTLDAAALSDKGLTYSFALDEGRTILKIS